TAPRGAESSARKMMLNGRARVFMTGLLRRVCCGCKLLGRLVSSDWNLERAAGRGLTAGIRLRTEHADRMVRSARSGGLQIRKEQTRTWIVLFLAGGDVPSNARYVGVFGEKGPN